ncbi:Na+/H+ antiporter NhaA [Legionella septentrionalis]|uniref:Na(+)/H(+) antiporter NhaA n=1 Tax=Legionella septentrionalis TaxID=2498109 RepID=A0A433JHK4_9GAMM|nr:Na+/H+ antiporter NhaA [Legionella septentrionalis]RUQ82077.1 Na+/H+ antiporter NhaA [Legionella septentrionalis]RUQ95545.1 Na+/H+ antiporter NhaA [Legionella septentrionalis]RUR08943.1 Na+/H+ antiporter NhaA [Legionella septentrionalis]RUR14728.1 Na+/H+ antiporter NhaA [Legionella septentrionalis]
MAKDSFYKLETLGGVLLFAAALIAIIIANSPYHLAYSHLFEIKGSIGIGSFLIKKPMLLWINDGLMAVYFLLIGLEIKREMRRGVLSHKKNLLAPIIAALSGLLIPALIFYGFNAHNPLYLKGWAIPTATDIAFTLGILSLLGSRTPLSLKILLTAIAIFDDIAAIVIIAVFYTHQLSLTACIFALLFTLILIGLNYFKCRHLSLFMVVGVVLWISVLKSGVHATLAGIVIAMTIPDEDKNGMLTRLEEGLHPWIVFLILPVFAFANAGVSFIGLHASIFVHPIVLGVALGLFLGKQTGIFLSLSYFMTFRKFLKTEHITLRQVYGVSLICGVGFTMSLFIGSLAYQYNDLNLMPMVKIGVVIGSLASGILGFLVLKKTLH